MLEEVSAYFYRHYKVMSRRPGELAWILVYPFIAIISIGVFAHFLMTKGAPMDTMLFAFVGVIVWNFYDLGQRAITYGITFEIWNHCLKHSFTTPAKLRHFIAGNAAFGIFSAVAALLLVGLVGYAAFGFNIFDAGVFLAINLFSVFVFATGVGLLIDSLMVSKGEKYMSLIWMGTGMIMIFSGIYYPVSVLPPAMQCVSSVMPSTHALASIRAVFWGNMETALTEFWVGFILSLCFFLAGAFTFKIGIRKGKENGYITKY